MGYFSARIFYGAFLLIGLGLGCSSGWGQEAEPAAHRHISTVVHADLKGLVSIVGSKDRKFTLDDVRLDGWPSVLWPSVFALGFLLEQS